ncbi:MAG: hypothetical protein A3C35_05000 [Omnitrophica bacterium RIFCSPHIGHO2_02_FULL_46_11]|nr:MAG: hypothetical protein A3C35_05000 [Omnitrophica bacterium RIFCSPHIGHO2_02_FULL_46_11]
MKSGFVSILGKPNVGKSTLLNRLVGTKLAAVSKKPQTTRQVIRGIRTEPRGQIVFLDTPGLHTPKDRLGKFMVREASKTFLEADVFYWLTDPILPRTDDFEYLNQLKLSFPRKRESKEIDPRFPPSGTADPPSRVAEKHSGMTKNVPRNDVKPIFCLINKVDSVSKPQLLPVIDEYQKKFQFQELIPISALQGDQIDLLLEKTFTCLPEHEPYFPPDIASDQTERFVAAEMIREKIFRFTGEEIPYSTVVQIEEFKEEESIVRIHAVIFTEKDSQKAILIGAKGQKMKQIGQAARQDLEQFLGKKVYLELWVKTLKNWKKDEGSLKRLGFQ